MPPKIHSKHSTPTLPPLTRLGAKSDSRVETNGANLSSDENEILLSVITRFEHKFDEFKDEIISLIKDKDKKIEELEEQISTLQKRVCSVED